MKLIWRFLLAYFLSTLLILAQGNSTGLIPINDLGVGYYKNYQGGFYPNGSNQIPAYHFSIGMTIAKSIKPRNSSGQIDTINGKYVFLSIGMSNTTQEFSLFKTIADTFKQKNSKLIIVDGAQGGQTASVISSSSANFWTIIDQRLQSSGVNAKQVEVCWLKEADAQPNKAFPVHAQVLTDELVKVAKIIKLRYPNCVIVYCSSRTYGGYATSTLNPEPYAYESGFSVKWLIEKQINQDTTLTCVGNNYKAPWLAWGPYLWADGLNQRSDGLTWSIDDFIISDRTHPSDSGRKKVAMMLLNFLIQDQTAKEWFLKKSVTDIDYHENILNENYFIIHQNYPNPFNPTTRILYDVLKPTWINITVYGTLGSKILTLADEWKNPGSYEIEFSILNQALSSGVYYCVISNNYSSQTRKILLIK